jgi:hypothetical protein
MAKRSSPERADKLSDDEKIVREAKKRFKRAEDWESTARKRYVEDTKFANADADNMYQWPSITTQARGYGTADERPCLTINKTRQYCLQIINDSRQNKTAIKIKPTGRQRGHRRGRPGARRPGPAHRVHLRRPERLRNRHPPPGSRRHRLLAGGHRLRRPTTPSTRKSSSAGSRTR